MTIEGTLTKMQTEFLSPIQYYLVFENDFLNLNQLLGKSMSFEFLGYQCLNCGKKKKIFRQGFCYDCSTSSASAGDWIMRPELSTAHLGIEDRDLDYEKKVQLQPHIVYLALSSEVKVGVTRKTQVPTRWIDQGAVEAIPIVEVPNRYLAGIAEVALKDFFVDKTNWRKMLQNEVPNIDLLLKRNELKEKLPLEVQPFFDATLAQNYQLHYPVLSYPKKVNSLTLDKSPFYEGNLAGIKGQYLIFEDQTVFNIRNHEGYIVKIKLGH